MTPQQEAELYAMYYGQQRPSSRMTPQQERELTAMDPRVQQRANDDFYDSLAAPPPPPPPPPQAHTDEKLNDDFYDQGPEKPPLQVAARPPLQVAGPDPNERPVDHPELNPGTPDAYGGVETSMSHGDSGGHGFNLEHFGQGMGRVGQGLMNRGKMSDYATIFGHNMRPTPGPQNQLGPQNQFADDTGKQMQVAMSDRRTKTAVRSGDDDVSAMLMRLAENGWF